MKSHSVTLLSAAVTGILWSLPAAATSPFEKGDAGVDTLAASSLADWAKGDGGKVEITAEFAKGDAGKVTELAAEMSTFEKGDAGKVDDLLAFGKGDGGKVESDEALPMGGAADAGAKHACKGQNACKGQGGCKTDKHACKGQNACKGQGGCNK